MTYNPKSAVMSPQLALFGTRWEGTYKCPKLSWDLADNSIQLVIWVNDPKEKESGECDQYGDPIADKEERITLTLVELDVLLSTIEDLARTEKPKEEILISFAKKSPVYKDGERAFGQHAITEKIHIGKKISGEIYLAVRWKHRSSKPTWFFTPGDNFSMLDPTGTEYSAALYARKIALSWCNQVRTVASAVVTQTYRHGENRRPFDHITNNVDYPISSPNSF